MHAELVEGDGSHEISILLGRKSGDKLAELASMGIGAGAGKVAGAVEELYGIVQAEGGIVLDIDLKILTGLVRSQLMK